MGKEEDTSGVDIWKITNILFGLLLGVFSYGLNWVVSAVLDHSVRIVKIENTMMNKADKDKIDDKINGLEKDMIRNNRKNF